MKKFENLESFEETKRWLMKNIGYKMFDEKNNITIPEGVDFNDALGLAVELLDHAKNSAVRAAVHQELIGGNVLIQYKSCEDGCAYYHPSTGNYLGRGVVDYACVLVYDFEAKEYADEIGYYPIDHRTPLDDLA